jgi:hypothetical protein
MILRQPLGIVLVGLVHLHLKRGTGMSSIETDHVEPAPAQFMHKPWRRRAIFNPLLASSPACRRTARWFRF